MRCGSAATARRLTPTVLARSGHRPMRVGRRTNRSSPSRITDPRTEDRGEQGEPPSTLFGVDEEAEYESADQCTGDADQDGDHETFLDVHKMLGDPSRNRADDDVSDPADAG